MFRGETGVQRAQRAHLVGIAGAGMSALADVLLQAGWTVSGSDMNAPTWNSHPLQRVGLGCRNESAAHAPPLHWGGISAFPGHAAAHISPDIDLLVYSIAVPPENVELRRAAELGIPTLSYAQMLGRLMSGKRGLAVAGTHGKSTTAAMTAHVLVASGLDPTAVFGAVPLGARSGGRCGRGDLVLVEACEYRGNFLHLQPHDAAILGIEPDHFDCYASPEQLEAAFAKFAASVSEGWAVAPPRGLCGDQAGNGGRRLPRGNLPSRGNVSRGRLVGPESDRPGRPLPL